LYVIIYTNRQSYDEIFYSKQYTYVKIELRYHMEKAKIELDNKTSNFILHLIDKMAIPTKTSLIKMCYLCDLVAFRENGKQITDFNYIRYYYGPFDKKIDEYLLTLVKEGKILSEVEYSSGGGEYEKFSLPKDKRGLSEYTDCLDEKEKQLSNSILESLGSLNAKMLTEIAYKTAPMKALKATLGGNEHLTEPLNLSLV